MRKRASAGTAAGLDAAAMRRIVRRFHADLVTSEHLINDLNVFPVPDGDTGTNCVLTVQAGLAGLDRGKRDLGALLEGLARDFALGARGNSGVILAEYFRGLAQRAGSDAQAWHEALTAAAHCAQEAVAVPREGTMLTVAQRVAQVATHDDFTEYATAISSAARASVDESTDLMPELAAAGVVDSGAVVLMLFHDAVASELRGEDMPPHALEHRRCDVALIDYHGPAFEVMFTFDSDDAARDSLREELVVIGDSVTITGQRSPYRVHVHVDRPAEAVAEGLRHGRVSDIDITALVQRRTPDNTQTTEGVGVVFVSDAAEVRKHTDELGAVFLPVLPTTAPSTMEFITAARACGTSHVIVLPSDVDAQASAALAAHELRDEGVTAHLINTRSTPQSLAALSVFDATAGLDSLLDAMTSAARGVRSGSVAVASRAAMTRAGMCQVGDVVGLIDDQPLEVSSQATTEDMLEHIVHALLDDGGEIVTVIVGSTGSLQARQRLASEHPGIDVRFIAGGQSATVYSVSVE